MRAGEYKHPVIVQQKSTSRGTGGEVVEEWTTFTTIRCKIITGKGKELDEARKETGKAAIVFECRYYPGITQGMRLSFDSRIFDIANIANIGEMNKKLVISAVETI